MYRLPRSLTLRQQTSGVWRNTPRARASRIQRRHKSQLLYQPTGEAVRYQAVRFKKPGLTMRRVATIGLYTGVVYAYLALLWRQMDVEIEILDEEDEEGQEQSHDQKDGESKDPTITLEEGPIYAAEDSTFIPLTWSNKTARQYYKGSDPEWQTFIKIAKDAPRHKKLQEELLRIVHAGSVQHPSIARQLGSEPKIGKYWLDISFPDGPPQEFERRGIEVGDGFVAWSTQRVSPEQQWRVQRALWPVAAAGGTWAMLKVLAGIQWRRAKQAVGWEGVDPFSPEQRWRSAVSVMEKQQSDRSSQSKVQTEPGGNPAAEVGSGSSPQAPQRSSSRPSGNSDQKKIPWLPNIPLPTSNSSSPSDAIPKNNPAATDIPIAMHVFSAALAKSWNPPPNSSPTPGQAGIAAAKPEPPKGCFTVSGLVEVRGAKGKMLFDVSSAYDPRQGKYVGVNAAVRSYKRWSQGPRGGP